MQLGHLFFESDSHHRLIVLALLLVPDLFLLDGHTHSIFSGFVSNLYDLLLQVFDAGELALFFFIFDFQKALVVVLFFLQLIVTVVEDAHQLELVVLRLYVFHDHRVNTPDG